MPSRSSSSVDTSTWPPMASAIFSTMASRCSGGGVPSGRALWGGMAAGISSSLSRPKHLNGRLCRRQVSQMGGIEGPAVDSDLHARHLSHFYQGGRPQKGTPLFKLLKLGPQPIAAQNTPSVSGWQE